MPVRETVVAGQFYPGTKSALVKALDGFMKKGQKQRQALGAVSPHAGYMYSGAVAGVTLSSIRPADCYVILGPNHTGKGAAYSVYPEGEWLTPLGAAAIDKELADELLASCRHLKADTRAHMDEHSIEVQIPFLQHSAHGFAFVPIVLQFGHTAVLQEIGAAIAMAVKKLRRNAVIIASSDMTHYESHESASEKDKKAISAIMDLDEDLLVLEVRDNDISMCGVAPAVSMLSAVKALGAKKAELISYMTSGETSGDFSEVVGYAGIVIE